MPPSAGPTTDAMCIRLIFHVTAFGNTSAGTSCGSSAVRAGRPTVIILASRKSSAYIHSTGPSMIENAASASDVAVIPIKLMIDSRRRSYRSASNPAGSASTISGSACASPTSPNESASPVLW